MNKLKEIGRGVFWITAIIAVAHIGGELIRICLLAMM